MRLHYLSCFCVLGLDGGKFHTCYKEKYHFSQMSAHSHIYIAHGAYWKQVASFQQTETLF